MWLYKSWSHNAEKGFILVEGCKIYFVFLCKESISYFQRWRTHNGLTGPGGIRYIQEHQAWIQSKSKWAAVQPPGATGDIEHLFCICVIMWASPVPWFHPGPCRNIELQSSGQTNAAASFSWCSAVSSASLPSAPSPDPEESRAWTPETTLRAPCSWTALHGHTHRDEVMERELAGLIRMGVCQGKIKKQLYIKTEDSCYFGIFFLFFLCCLAVILKIHQDTSWIIIHRSLPWAQLSPQAWPCIQISS